MVVLGSFMDVVPPPAAIGALEHLLAWKLSLHGVPDPRTGHGRGQPRRRRLHAVCSRRARVAATRRRPPRWRPDELPRQWLLRPAAIDPPAGGKARGLAGSADDVRFGRRRELRRSGHRVRASCRPASGSPLAADRSSSRRSREAPSRRSRRRRPPPTGAGARRSHPPATCSLRAPPPGAGRRLERRGDRGRSRVYAQPFAGACSWSAAACRRRDRADGDLYRVAGGRRRLVMSKRLPAPGGQFRAHLRTKGPGRYVVIAQTPASTRYAAATSAPLVLNPG